MPSTNARKPRKTRGDCKKFGVVQSGIDKGRCRTRMPRSTGKKRKAKAKPKKKTKAKPKKKKASTGKKKKSKAKPKKKTKSSSGKKSARRGSCVKWGRSEITKKCRKGPVTRGPARAEYLPSASGLPASWTADMFAAPAAGVGWGKFTGRYASRGICKHGRRKTASGAWGGCRTEAEARNAREAYLKRTGKEERWFQGQCANPPPCLPNQVPYKLATGELCCRNKKNQEESYKEYTAAAAANKVMTEGAEYSNRVAQADANFTAAVDKANAMKPGEGEGGLMAAVEAQKSRDAAYKPAQVVA